MAVQKTGSSSVLERAVQWAKDVGGKIKTVVAEYTGASGYAKADKPAVKPHNASNARAAGKFAGKVEDFRILSGGDWNDSLKIRQPPIHGEYYQRILSDDGVGKLLEEALKDPQFTDHLSDINRRLIELNKK